MPKNFVVLRVTVVLEKDKEDLLGRSCENMEELHTVKEDRNILYTIKWRAN
jgi:hypothetical protein